MLLTIKTFRANRHDCHQQSANLLKQISQSIKRVFVLQHEMQSNNLFHGECKTVWFYFSKIRAYYLPHFTIMCTLPYEKRLENGLNTTHVLFFVTSAALKYCRVERIVKLFYTTCVLFLKFVFRPQRKSKNNRNDSRMEI